MSDRRRINLSVPPELYAELEKRAGPTVPVPTFVLGLMARALKLDREPELGLAKPQQVAIDVDPLLAPLRMIEDRLEEVHRAVERTRHYLMIRAPDDKHQSALYAARNAAERELADYERQRNGDAS